MGVATGGAALLFSPNNETGDNNMDTFLWVGAGVGGAGGFVLGTFIPEGAELSAGLRLPQRWGATFLRWPSPYVAPVKLHDEQGVEIGARLIDLAF